MQMLSRYDDSHAGVMSREIKARRRKMRLNLVDRTAVLRKVLIDGPAWGMSTAEMIMKVSKKVFKGKRIGAKAAKTLDF